MINFCGLFIHGNAIICNSVVNIPKYTFQTFVIIIAEEIVRVRMIYNIFCYFQDVSFAPRFARLAPIDTGLVIDGFDKIIVYYDNGQIELGAILNTVFSIHFSNVEFRKAEPQKYRLLQAADFICSMELLKIKKIENRLSKSEKQFFYKPQETGKLRKYTN